MVIKGESIIYFNFEDKNWFSFSFDLAQFLAGSTNGYLPGTLVGNFPVMVREVFLLAFM